MISNTKHYLIRIAYYNVFIMFVSSLLYGQIPNRISFDDTFGTPDSPQDSSAFHPSLISHSEVYVHHFQAEHEPSIKDSNVTVVGRWAWGECIAIAARNHYVFIGNGGLFQVLDVENPQSPNIVGEVLTDGIIEGIDISGNYAAVTTVIGLSVIDISEPTNPQEIGSIEIIGEAWRVKVSGNYAYVVTYPGNLHIIDITDPRQPREIGEQRVASRWAYDVAIHENYAYVASENDYLFEIVDISDPTSPLAVKGQFVTGGYVLSVTVHEHYLLVGGGSRFWIYDISDPVNPSLISYVSVGGAATSIAVNGNYAYLSLNENGFTVIDISNVEHPIVVANNDNETPTYAVVSEKYAYIATYLALWVIDISVPYKPEEITLFPTGSQARQVRVSKNYAYVAEGYAGLWIIDISIPSTPQSVANFPTGGFANDLVVSDGYAYVLNFPFDQGDTTGGLWIIDVSDPTKPEGISFYRGGIHYPRGWWILNTLTVSDNYAFVTQSDSGLIIIDISDPENPHAAGFFASESPLRDIDVFGNFAFLAEENGFRIIDISNPLHIWEIGSFSKYVVLGIKVIEEIAYLATDVGLAITDVSDPMNVSELGKIQTGGSRSEVEITISNSHAYIAYGLELQIVDVSDRMFPEVVGYFSSRSNANGVYSDGEYIYIADGIIGVWILRDDAYTSVNHEDFDNSVEAYSLQQNHPNPFNQKTDIKYRIADSKSALLTTLRIYNILGQEIRTLVYQINDPGYYEVTWDGRDNWGRKVASDVYLYRLEVGDFTQVKKLTLLR